jgi:hypothetical protein
LQRDRQRVRTDWLSSPDSGFSADWLFGGREKHRADVFVSLIGKLSTGPREICAQKAGAGRLRQAIVGRASRPRGSGGREVQAKAAQRRRQCGRRRLEVRAGIEPASADLQSDASPLCHRTPERKPRIWFAKPYRVKSHPATSWPTSLAPRPPPTTPTNPIEQGAQPVAPLLPADADIGHASRTLILSADLSVPIGRGSLHLDQAPHHDPNRPGQQSFSA